MNKYFLEIGVEEFPSRFIASTKEQLKNNVLKILTEDGLSVESSRIESTPRRFALWLEGIGAVNTESFEVVRGPSARVAYDQEGQPTKALEGFMRSKGLNLEDIYVESNGKEDYVFANITKEAISPEAVLKKAIPEAIRQISNPRSMRWGGKNLRFLRPIRWLVSLYNDEVLDFDLEGIPVGRTSKGHRFLGRGQVEIPTIDSYEETLKEQFVIVDESERRNIIVRGLNRKAREHGGLPMHDDNLLDEVVAIVEYPTVFIGEIPQNYLDLPQEVIITPMKDHQRYFPVLDDGGKLLPYFLSVRNGNEEGIENVVAGNEKVLVPRLEDAKFFYDQDLSQSLEDYLPKLDDLIFHENLGTMLDKTQRLESLTRALAENMDCGHETTAAAVRAAHLSKADLVTQMVVEFTELQGIMGRIYAEKNGEESLVASAIEEQYMPKGAGGQVPQSTPGIILSLADKMDNIAGLFAIGVQVTGSQDPFGLRRAANGIIDILFDASLHINLWDGFRDALVLYVEEEGLVFDYDEIMETIYSFFLGRLRTKMDELGIRYDVIDAVFASKEKDLLSLINLGQTINDFLKEDSGDLLITDFVRIESLARKDEGRALTEEVLEEDDQALYQSLNRKEPVEAEIEKGHYREALDLLRDWMPIVNDYLDKTMIMVEDESLRSARLAMLNTIYQVIARILVPSAIVRE